MLNERDENLSRDPEILLRDVSVSIRLRDIKYHQRLLERLSIRWWEQIFLILLFFSTIGFLLTLITLQFSDLVHPPLLMRYALYVFFGFMMISLIATLEFLLSKVKTLRQIYEMFHQDLSHLEKQVASLQEEKDNSPE